MENKNFKELYLKYKLKYINLKNSQKGGNNFDIPEFINLNSADNTEIVTSVKDFISDDSETNYKYFSDLFQYNLHQNPIIFYFNNTTNEGINFNNIVNKYVKNKFHDFYTEHNLMEEYKHYTPLMLSNYKLNQIRDWKINLGGTIINFKDLSTKDKLKILSRLTSFLPAPKESFIVSENAKMLDSYLKAFYHNDKFLYFEVISEKKQPEMLYFYNPYHYFLETSVDMTKKLHVLFNSNFKYDNINLYLECLNLFFTFYLEESIIVKGIETPIHKLICGKIVTNRLYAGNKEKKGIHSRKVWTLFNGRKMADLVIYTKISIPLEILKEIGKKINIYFKENWKFPDNYFDNLKLEFNFTVDGTLQEKDGKFFVQYTTGGAGNQKIECIENITKISKSKECTKDGKKETIEINLDFTSNGNSKINNNIITSQKLDSLSDYIVEVTYKNTQGKEPIIGLKNGYSYLIKRLTKNSIQLLDINSKNIIPVSQPINPGNNDKFITNKLYLPKEISPYCEQFTIDKDVKVDDNFRIDCQTLDKEKYPDKCLVDDNGKYIGKILNTICIYDEIENVNKTVCTDDICLK